MRNFRSSPEVNAGSMADIAFLLLIFFLVSTTIPKDKGIARILSKPCPPQEQPCSIDINKRNVLLIKANEAGELYVNDDLMELKDLKATIVDFIDNNGDGSCNYCKGLKDEKASVNPNLAAISIDVQATAQYKHLVSIENEITKSYKELRTRFAKEKFNKSPDELTKAELQQVKEAYPFRISEAKIQ